MLFLPKKLVNETEICYNNIDILAFAGMFL